MFMISGFNKLFCPICHAMLERNFIKSHIPCPVGMSWWVAFWEFTAGLTLVLGLFTGASAFILFVVCLIAFIVSWRRKLEAKHPVHFLDACTEVLCMFDVLLAQMLLAIMLIGPGAYSLDHLWWPV